MSEFVAENAPIILDENKIELEAIYDRQRIIRSIGEIALSSVELSNKKSKQEVQQRTISEFEARPYQIDAWLELQNARKAGADRGLINLATGLGKTTVATFDYAMFRKERLENNQSAKGLFVVHQNNILDQAGKSFRDLMPDLNIKRYQSKNSKSLDSDFNLATFQSLTAGIKNGSIREDDFDYIVYDEAHHIEADTFKQVVDHLKPAFQLGLTATPERMDEKDITEHFGEALYTKTLPEAIVDGYLAKVDYNIMFDDAVKLMIDDDFNPATIAEINELFNYEPRNEEIVRNILAEQNKIKRNENLDNIKTIIFCEDKNHADNIAELMNGISYHSGFDKKDQNKTLSLFRNGDLNTITTVNMFNEGVDIPDTRMIVFLRTTQSRTIFEQQLGRGLRKADGKDRVTVLDFVANIERAAQLREFNNKIEKNYREKQDSDGGDIEKPINAIDYNAKFIFEKKITDLLNKYYVIKEKLDIKSDQILLSNDELVALYKQLAPDETPSRLKLDEMSKDEVFLSYATISKRFGGLAEFRLACGYKKLKDYDNCELVELYKQLAPGEIPTREILDDMCKDKDFLSYPTIFARFGSLVEFQLACGYKELKDYDNCELVELYKQLAPSEIPTREILNDMSKDKIFLSYGTVFKRFGSLVEFQLACGYKTDK